MEQSRHSYAVFSDSLWHVFLTFLVFLTLLYSISYSASSQAQAAKPLSLNIGHAQLTALEWSGSNSKDQTIIALPWGGYEIGGYWVDLGGFKWRYKSHQFCLRLKPVGQRRPI